MSSHHQDKDVAHKSLRPGDSVNLNRRKVIKMISAALAFLPSFATAKQNATSGRVRRLVHDYLLAEKAWRAASSAWADAEHLALSQYPSKPARLRARSSDVMDLCAPLSGKYYGKHDREHLQKCQCTTYFLSPGPIGWRVDESKVANRDEILKALDGWLAECAEVDAAVKLPELEKEKLRLLNIEQHLFTKIEELDGSSLEVLQAKAIAYTTICPLEEIAEDDDYGRLKCQIFSGLLQQTVNGENLHV